MAEKSRTRTLFDRTLLKFIEESQPVLTSSGQTSDLKKNLFTAGKVFNPAALTRYFRMADLRRATDMMKGAIGSKAKIVEKAIESIQNITGQPSTSEEQQASIIYNNVVNGVFTILDPDSQSSVDKTYSEWRKYIKTYTNWVGARIDTAYDNLLKDTKNYDQLVSENKLFYYEELRDFDEKEVVSYFEAKAMGELKELWNTFVSDYYSFVEYNDTQKLNENAIFNFSWSDFFEEQDGSIVAKNLDLKNITVYFVYRYGIEKYNYLKFRTTCTIQNSLKYIQGEEEKKKVPSVKSYLYVPGIMDVSIFKPLIAPPELLQKEIASRRAGLSVFDFGHVISIISLKFSGLLYTLEDFYDSIAEDNTYSESDKFKLKNLVLSLKTLQTVSLKIDSIIQGVEATEGLTSSDVLYILQNYNIDHEKLHFFSKTKGLIVRGGTIERTETISINEGEINIKGVRFGILELASFNAAKAVLQGKLERIFRRKLNKLMEDPLIIEKLLLDLGAVKSSDSLLTASIKMAFGLKIKKGSTKTKKHKSFGYSIHKAKDLGAFTSRVKMRKSKKAQKQEKRKKQKSFTLTSEGSLPSSLSLIDLIRVELESEVIAQMVPPALENRTGRFARSAEVLSYTNNTAMIKYMYNPYRVFSQSSRPTSWNRIKERDPKAIIDRAIINILGRYSPQSVPLFKSVEG